MLRPREPRPQPQQADRNEIVAPQSVARLELVKLMRWWLHPSAARQLPTALRERCHVIHDGVIWSGLT